MSGGRSLVGIIANPAAGKDIRRLVSAASPVSDMAKIGIIRRAAIGAMEGGADRLLVSDDRQALARRALDEIGVAYDVVDQPLLSTGRDTQRASAAMAEAGVGSVVVLGGDGTHRDVAKGWRDAPMVAVSTGTNNVFPRALEATTAGQAAGLIAAGTVRLDGTGVAHRAKVIEVRVTGSDGSSSTDLGLVDVALTSSSFLGSRAVWDMSSLRAVVTAIAEPGTVGLSSLAAALAPVGRREAGGVSVSLEATGDADSGGRGAQSRCGVTIRCPVAPGRYDEVVVAEHRRLPVGESVRWTGPAALGFDGERDLLLKAHDTAELRIAEDGPWVIDVGATLRAATGVEQRTRGRCDG